MVMSNSLKFWQAFHAAPPYGNFLAGVQKFATKCTKTTKGDENVYKDSFVLFVSFVVKQIFVWP
jgi:hypothetical protein